MLNTYLEQLRTHGLRFYRPAKNKEVAALEARAGAALPPELSALYHAHNGQSAKDLDDHDCVGYRLLKIREVLDELDAMAECDFAEHPDLLAEFLPCWGDDNSSFMVIYVRGPLTGRIAMLDHNAGGQVLELSHRSVTSLYGSLVQECETEDGGTDYPITDADEQSHAEDAQLFEHYLQRYREERDPRRRIVYAYHAINLSPFDKTAAVVQLLDGPDYGALQFVIGRLVIDRGYREAIPAFAALIGRPGQQNALVPRDILGAMPFPEAATALIQAAPNFHPTQIPSVIDLLKKHGYESRMTPQAYEGYDGYEVRKPGDGAWIAVRGSVVRP